MLFCGSTRGDDIGDISVDTSAIYTGNTYHGYAEIRVDLQNRSHSKSHTVTLVFPNSTYGGYGNNISRLLRTVTLAPESLETVSLLQPPLPSQGDSSIHVDVDDGREGEIHAPNANNHCNYYSRGGPQSGTVFISRSVDDDAVEHLFHANQGAFTAAMAVGPPDATGPGVQPATWMPDSRRYGQTNWLELDYAKPEPVNKVLVYETQSQKLTCSIDLIGVAGTNIDKIPKSAGKLTSSGSGWISEYDFKATDLSVKTVRLNFGKAPPYSVAVDAVQISGPSETQWASDARASSDNSAMGPAYMGSASGTDPVESLRSESPVSDWSETWLAYSPFDIVVLGAADISSMSPAVLGAIGNYLHAGGTVVVFNEADLPAAWHTWQQNKLADGVESKIGFGRCFTFNSENPSSLDKQSMQILRNAVRDSAAYWQSLPSDNNSAESVLPIHGNLKIPTRGIVLIMLAFVVLIGPVNIVLLNRYKRRIWMLWTIPVISFFTTLLVFVYSLLNEGITPDIRIAGLTVLDQVSHHAATLGGTAFYCPLTPSRGLNFDYETEATPLVRVGYGAGSSREVDWSQSQHFQRGWVSARIPAYFHIRKSEISRERIEVSNENGALQIVNGLGAPIKSLWLADANMNLYEANNVAAGQKTALISSKQLRTPERSGPYGLKRDMGFSISSADILDSSSVQTYLMPNTYIAVLDGNPFIEDALTSTPNPKHTKSVSVVFGILNSAETK